MTYLIWQLVFTVIVYITGVVIGRLSVKLDRERGK